MRSTFTRFAIIALVLGCFVRPGPCEAKFYRFVDEEGRTHFVDDISKVPDRFLPDLDEYKERYDHLPQEERAARIKEDRRRDEAREEKRQIEELEALARQRERAAEATRQETRRSQDSPGRQMETKVVVKGNQILVPVRLGYAGQEIGALLLLDTGASTIVIHREVADQLNLHPETEGVAQLVGGSRIRTEVARLSYFAVGPKTDKDTPVVIIDHEGPPVAFDGLLGMNFLRKVKYSVDYDNQVILWEP